MSLMNEDASIDVHSNDSRIFQYLPSRETDNTLEDTTENVDGVGWEMVGSTRGYNKRGNE